MLQQGASGAGMPTNWGDGPLHVLRADGGAVGGGRRELLERLREVRPPLAGQVEVLVEDRVTGEDRFADADGQFRPVGDAVLGHVVQADQRGAASIEAAQRVLCSPGAFPQLPGGLVFGRGHQAQPRGYAGGGAGRGTQGAPGPSPELAALFDRRGQGLGRAAVVGAHALLYGRVRRRRVHQ
ncbi:hypothetical protein GCM10020295_83440 [Streptomyces cinereospinus]